jgi:fido (protein-threonine AMPylation protein)
LIRTLRLTEELISIHSLILGNTSQRADKYRNQFAVKKMVLPHQIHKIQKDRGAFLTAMKELTSSFHPLLATEMQQRILAIYPFTNGNGKVSRLIMNLVFLQNG